MLTILTEQRGDHIGAVGEVVGRAELYAAVLKDGDCEPGERPTSIETKLLYLYIAEHLYCGHLGDLVKCPVKRDVLISGVNFY